MSCCGAFASGRNEFWLCVNPRCSQEGRSTDEVPYAVAGVIIHDVLYDRHAGSDDVPSSKIVWSIGCPVTAFNAIADEGRTLRTIPAWDRLSRASPSGCSNPSL